jgi:two-component system sensor histidine kinase KdpD
LFNVLLQNTAQRYLCDVTIDRRPLRTWPVGVGAGALAVAVVAGAVALVDNWVPVLSLGVLFVFAVLPIAVVWGTLPAVLVAVASMLTFNFFFLPPVHTFTLEDSRNWFALAVYLATAVVVGALGSRARRQTAEAQQRERESGLLADVASGLLRGAQLDEELHRIERRAAEVLGVSSVTIDLEHDGPRSERDVIETPEREEPELGVRRRVVPALTSLLTVAHERERLAREAMEAEALRRSDAIKTAVIQAVSHDLRTPLATIEAALGGLESGLLDLSESDRHELLETIRLEHGRLKRLVENLLDLSRIQARAAPPAPELWTADELVWQALEDVDGRERVRVVVPEHVPAARVDAVQIQRVLANLVENALKFSPADEQVSVMVNATRKEVLIRVTDMGPGVPSAESERIFEPFHRVPGASEPTGAGLGLAIARGFAEANGGRLWVESRAGQGATFTLALPVVEIPVSVEI